MNPTEKKKILFVCSRFPYPPIDGARKKNFNLIQRLSSLYQLKIVVVSHEQVSPEYLSKFSEFGEVFLFKKTWLSSLLHMIVGLMRLRPLQVSMFDSFRAKKHIRELGNDCDLIYATLVRTAPLVWGMEKPKICDMADSIGMNYRAAAKQSSSQLMRLYYRLESALLMRYEHKVVAHFDQSLLFNMHELQHFNRPDKTQYIPHGVSELLLTYSNQLLGYEDSICFLGKMDYQPNIDAVIWFVRHVMPLLDAQIRFFVIGAAPTEEILKLASERVIVTGFIDDPFTIAHSCFAMVAPMQTGGGIQNKVLEGMALARANVLSLLAARPMLDAENRVHFFVAKTPSEYADAIHFLARNEAFRDSMGEAARSYIRDNFTWRACFMAYENVIKKVIGNDR